MKILMSVKLNIAAQFGIALRGRRVSG